MDSAIRLRGLHKRFGETVAVADLDLDIEPGEFFSMLGPSGSGKTTVLRCIAGFEQPTSGTVELFGADVTALAPFARPVNTVFQDYALFPHLSVIANVEYGLKVAGVARKERRARAEEALGQVRLAGLEDRRPHELSGGQRQRVALARAIVLRPQALLLDEPLGALDLKLREQMQVELKELQRSLGITFVFVTHDQDEALTLSDRVAVFDAGEVVQLGTPREVYDHPRNRFIASFVGSATLLEPEVAEALGLARAPMAVRPERVLLDAPAGGVPGTIAEVIYTGPEHRIVVDLDGLGARITALEPNIGAGHRRTRGDRVTVSVEPASAAPLEDEAA
ncbi:ABC transporter ATP-binding protein [Demequina mangrovi]|uniref:Putative spermidine/putrescine transport system ATP-binding protein n=1 Tax=Demequina mangrovi TaxID=1043493 RepID=A0A1H6ZX13_9MICO|nr:ABC transporter ATP-binding protein [Demequina mangrovi]SEJ57186.1 putative spermidine/putrescine transport system ATP-binding protein [Demequina mangrovi]